MLKFEAFMTTSVSRFKKSTVVAGRERVARTGGARHAVASSVRIRTRL